MFSFFNSEDFKLKERVGFEPTETFKLRLISNQVQSTNSATSPGYYIIVPDFFRIAQIFIFVFLY
jgi:hypothetical protein